MTGLSRGLDIAGGVVAALALAFGIGALLLPDRIVLALVAWGW
jgi:hypothetical protein